MIAELIHLAIASGILGAIVTCVMLFAVSYFGIDLSHNWWLVAVPLTFSVTMNMCLIEMLRRHQKKK